MLLRCRFESLSLAVAAVSVLGFPNAATAEDNAAPNYPVAAGKQVQYSPYPEQNYPNSVFFGDTHLHTSYSTDAGMVGCTLGPEDAYRFARGETVLTCVILPAARCARLNDGDQVIGSTEYA